MHVILGAAGHVGSAVAADLLERGEPILAITRTADEAHSWQAKGAHAEAIDVLDTNALRDAFRRGRRLFLLNPPAAPATDTDVEERRTLASILAAAEDAGLEKIVAASTYGARPGAHIADSGVLYEMEQALQQRALPATVIRSAYYLSNWDASLKSARQTGRVSSFYPPDFTLPMVAPRDIAAEAARLMLTGPEPDRIEYVEGPQRYTPADVATAFAHALGRDVEAVQVVRGQWTATLHAIGFCDAAAQAFAAMTAATLESPELPAGPKRGSTTLQQYVDDLARSDYTAGQ